MDCRHGESHFRSSIVQNLEQGCVALELHREFRGTEERVAAVTFWDASGQFFVETFGTDVNLEVLEQLIAEARVSIKVR